MCYNKFFSSEHTNIKISGKQSVLPDSESRKDRRTENALVSNIDKESKDSKYFGGEKKWQATRPIE